MSEKKAKPVKPQDNQMPVPPADGAVVAAKDNQMPVPPKDEQIVTMDNQMPAPPALDLDNK
ncbi:hypothetical protein DMH26_39385 [Streptomyces sp. WAC 05379]|uniref:hypothetical protein n=1 Tax=Streptomyces TaxID=1883 RepID=UPI000D3BF207|nr:MULTISPECIES: hypothetical protein [Streptomyces]MBT1095018.1 hypothetical protein [Streptomyces sp. Tu102]RSN78772.1 hypothetical protein DMH26_39385 [Streptomyces sp. WAC 05379]